MASGVPFRKARRYAHKLPPLSTEKFTWLILDDPKFFRGTAYSDGSTTINHAFLEARRSGYGGVIIADELHDTDEEEPQTEDDAVTPERDPDTNSMGMQENQSQYEIRRTAEAHAQC